MRFTAIIAALAATAIAAPTVSSPFEQAGAALGKQHSCCLIYYVHNSYINERSG